MLHLVGRPEKPMKDKIVNDKSYLASTFSKNCLLLMYFIYDILLTIESRVGVVMLKDSNY